MLCGIWTVCPQTFSAPHNEKRSVRNYFLLLAVQPSLPWHAHYKSLTISQRKNGLYYANCAQQSGSRGRVYLPGLPMLSCVTPICSGPIADSHDKKRKQKAPLCRKMPTSPLNTRHVLCTNCIRSSTIHILHKPSAKERKEEKKVCQIRNSAASRCFLMRKDSSGQPH